MVAATLLRAWRGLLIAVVLLGALGALAIAGIPLAWIRHVRIALAVDAIGQGLAALPRVLVPYNGINEWVRVVTLLGAALLLLAAAALLALAPRPLTVGARAMAALPLLALAVLPMTLARPKLPYVQGVVLFALLALFLWGERVRLRAIPAALGLATLAAGGSLLLAPTLDSHHPWLNYQALAGNLAPGNLESFDWSQRYGPLHWPRAGREVFDVKASRPEYWKAEDLSVFDGRGWVAGAVAFEDPLARVDAGAQARFTQTIRVTLRAIKTGDVIAAGAAAHPANLPGVVLPGAVPGTWTSSSELGPGDSYAVTTYTPQPSGRELAAISAADFGLGAPSSGYRAEVLPPVYAPVFALAHRLARGARTPYAYVMNVERYLARGFAYDENPPRRRYPLVAFLTRDRRGYCQQFAGAMALLLRMGGIPARVAAGFTTGSYDRSRGAYTVSDLDAHSWVEAWFPHYGWVAFDPTPTAAPARGGQAALPALKGGGRTGTSQRAQRRRTPRQAVTPGGGAPARRGRGGGWSLPLLIVVLVALLALTLLVVRHLRSSPDDPVAELERALERCGRPASGGTTLAALEQRFRSSPEAADYVRALRLRRYAGADDLPRPAARRAVRAQLRLGLGALGPLRALWALPPHLHWR